MPERPHGPEHLHQPPSLIPRMLYEREIAFCLPWVAHFRPDWSQVAIKTQTKIKGEIQFASHTSHILSA